MRLRSASVTILLPIKISLVWLRLLLFHIRPDYSWQQETGREYVHLFNTCFYPFQPACAVATCWPVGP